MTVRLLWPDDFDARAEIEAEWRGYLSRVRVELDDGRVYPVCFIDPVRLQQDVETAQPPIVAEVGLIVVAEVTRRTMEDAVAVLEARGFFEYFRPLTEDDRPWDV